MADEAKTQETGAPNPGAVSPPQDAVLKAVAALDRKIGQELARDAAVHEKLDKILAALDQKNSLVAAEIAAPHVERAEALAGVLAEVRDTLTEIEQLPNEEHERRGPLARQGLARIAEALA